MTQPTGGVWIADYYYTALTGEALAVYLDGNLVEIEVDGKLFVPAEAGTRRCSECKHTMSPGLWDAYLIVVARTKDEYVEMDGESVCPACGKGMMEEVA